MDSLSQEYSDQADGRSDHQCDLSLTTPNLLCHPDAQTEWWHYNGHLQNEARRFGFQLTFFRRRTDGLNHQHLPFAWPGCPVLHFGHFAVTEIEDRRFHVAHHRSTDRHCVSTDTYRLQVGQFKALQSDETHQLEASTRNVRLSLEFEAAKPGVRNGTDGIIRRVDGQTATHISFTRLTATGKLWIEGRHYTVTGSAWLDCEFGQCDFSQHMCGWDWFAIQLTDNREIMVYQVYDDQHQYNGHRYLAIVEPSGQAQQFRDSEFTISPIGEWLSPWTNSRYPTHWSLEIPALKLTLRISPLVDCQELDTRGSTNIVYWEGACDVMGRQGHSTLSGNAYVELVGYHPSDRKITQPIIGWWELLKNELRFVRHHRGRTLADARPGDDNPQPNDRSPAV